MRACIQAGWHKPVTPLTGRGRPGEVAILKDWRSPRTAPLEDRRRRGELRGDTQPERFACLARPADARAPLRRGPAMAEAEDATFNPKPAARDEAEQTPRTGAAAMTDPTLDSSPDPRSTTNLATQRARSTPAPASHRSRTRMPASPVDAA